MEAEGEVMDKKYIANIQCNLPEENRRFEILEKDNNGYYSTVICEGVGSMYAKLIISALEKYEINK